MKRAALIAAMTAGAALSQNPAFDPEAARAGSKTYAAACAGCHGSTGEGGRGPNLADNRVVRRRTDAELAATILRGVQGSDMPPFPIGEERARQVAAFVRSMSAPAIDSPNPGDPVNGRAVFEGKGGCSGCHAVAGRGGSLGPDLTNAGSSKSYKYLRESLLRPNARIASGFQGVEVTLKDGRKVSGIARNVSNYSIQVTGRDGAIHRLDAGGIREAVYRKTSYMPADYESRLSKPEVDDVLAYLSRQSLRSAE